MLAMLMTIRRASSPFAGSALPHSLDIRKRLAIGVANAEAFGGVGDSPRRAAGSAAGLGI